VKLASYAELDSKLGTEDLYNLLEIHSIDAHNARVARQPEK
jgi:hypothetical protein